MDTNGNFRMVYERGAFIDSESARTHFDAHWQRTDANAYEEMKTHGASTPDEYFRGGGASYSSEGWKIIRHLETVNLTGLKEGARSQLGEETITACPRCGRSALPWRVPPPFSVTVYFHKVALKDGEAFASEKCIVEGGRNDLVELIG